MEAVAVQGPVPERRPTSTYRLQLNSGFPLAAAAGIVDYLHALGVGDAYLSPIAAARCGSLHGYDVVDPTRINPEIGSDALFATLAERLRAHDMGLVLDIVPNHMCVADPANAWWRDVLEYGQASRFAHYFDIDWHPLKPELDRAVLLPVLGESFGQALEHHAFTVEYGDGAFLLRHDNLALPLTPRSWRHIFQMAAEAIQTSTADQLQELEHAALQYPAPRASDGIADRRQREELSAQLAEAMHGAPELRDGIESALQRLNSAAADTPAMQRLEALLEEQAYRLSFWGVAAEEINYRRFFDVSELAALRVEDDDVFDAVHRLPLSLLRAGLATGLRVDHVDGLRRPLRYLTRLRDQCQQAGGTMPFVVVEKILLGEERLPRGWPVAGTTGYDGLALLNQLFTHPDGAGPLLELHGRFTGNDQTFGETAHQAKLHVLDTSLAGELEALAHRLDRISEQHYDSRDLTVKSLRRALGEVIACFPVYRSYMDARDENLAPEDRAVISHAIASAQRHDAATDPMAWRFIESVLLADYPPGITDEQRDFRLDFVMRFQQLTSAVMAKGVEDTAFYRWFALASLDEVGDVPDAFHLSDEAFHARNAARQEQWPGTLIATSTHDTKRSEDVRTRIRVLSEVPLAWARAVKRWRGMNRAHWSSADGGPIDRSAEYLFYQSLLGVWPAQPITASALASVAERVHRFMEKAVREAKQRTSWRQPDPAYEQALHVAIAATLDPARGDFVGDFSAFAASVLRPAHWAGLGELLLKIIMPGVPDFYQGTEIWDYRLVDPDNRGPVDFTRRQNLLTEIDRDEQENGRGLADLAATPEDDRVKLWVTSRALRFRRAHAALFRDGGYSPLVVRGPRADNVVGFCRKDEAEEVIVITGRYFVALMPEGEPPIGESVWRDTTVTVGKPGARYRDVLTGVEFQPAQDASGSGVLSVAAVLGALPLALLERLA